jgi:NADPH-dependent 2,4-dienoyl-CoA reductase/sulfur reductase-like enzyme
MPDYRYIILGGGLAAGYAAQTFAEEGVQPGELAILSAEATLPYERPPLSKSFLAGKKPLEKLLINPASFYQEHGIEVRLETVVGRVDLEKRQLEAGGERFGFEKLMLATGSRPRRLEVPGADLERVYTLRQLEDAQQIREAAGKANRAVVIGGGFIGMEVTAVLRQLGLATTLVIRDERVWPTFFTPSMSAFFENYYRQQGVELVTKAEVAALVGNGHVSDVVLASGEALAADLVVAGIGVVPNLELFQQEGNGLQIEDGILVNSYLETGVAGVYAVGDIARYEDSLFGGKRRRVEHWDNAKTQGKCAAQAMMGKHQEFFHAPYFFSDVFDLSYEFWGDSSNATDVIYRGQVHKGQFSTWWIQDGRIRGAFVMNRPKEERELAALWVETGNMVVSLDDLADDTMALSPLVDENSTPG